MHTHNAVQMIFICYAGPFSTRPTTYWEAEKTCFAFMAVGCVCVCWGVLRGPFNKIPVHKSLRIKWLLNCIEKSLRQLFAIFKLF